jgi:hypothetical protein
MPVFTAEGLYLMQGKQVSKNQSASIVAVPSHGSVSGLWRRLERRRNILPQKTGGLDLHDRFCGADPHRRALGDRLGARAKT